MESRPDKLLVPRIVRHTCGSAMDGEHTPTVLDPLLEGGELGCGKEVWTKRLQEDDGFVGGEVAGCKDGGVVCSGYVEGGVLSRQALEEGEARGDRGVAVAGGFGEDEDGEAGAGGHFL